ncbi:MAG: NrdH-redoxin [Bacteroidetes bacterium]|nr:MAG: NrdH-redoxin [Bacteroidota bacterium]
MLKQIDSYNELIKNIDNAKKAYLLLYKENSTISNCALNNIEQAVKENNKFLILTADVTTVRDIHDKYSITSVPSLLKFENGDFKNVVKGCNDANFYKSLFDENIFSASNDNDVPQKRVVVYSTPTCSYCNQLKKYFDQHNIKYRNIDVSKDQKAAEEMVKRSGQQGVPQTNINGQIVIGFDILKINRLLNISN